MLEKYAFVSKILLCKILLMLYDSNAFKPYICFDFHNLSMYHIHIDIYIYSIGPTPNSVEY
jgi:hypothetical protein